MKTYPVKWLLTQFGFIFGSAQVTRLMSSKAKGSVCLGIESKKHKIEVYALRGGKIRIFENGKEWKP